jgi:aminopeptidase
MTDIRIQRMAQVLVSYSLEVQKGQRLAVFTAPAAIPLAREVYRKALHVGAFPEIFLDTPGVQEILLTEGSDEQLTSVPLIARASIEEYDARLLILAQENTKALQQIDPARLAMQSKARQYLVETMGRRTIEGNFHWCTTLYPTNAYAQDAGMSLAAFEDFVYQGCFVDEDDPVAHWQELGRLNERCIRWLVGKREVHILCQDTDLRFSIEGRTFINDDGHLNFPDGEIFSAPIEETVNGHIHFSFPAVLNGLAIADISLRLENGVVVEAHAPNNQDFLDHMLSLDEGARRVGEIAFGTNERIQRGIQLTLFDEKIGGTFHMALGSSIQGTGGRNVSAIHWDMVCDLRSGGEVWVDGELFCKDGQFVIA